MTIIIIYITFSNRQHYRLHRQTDPFISHIARFICCTARVLTHNNITVISHQSSHNNNNNNIKIDDGCGKYMIYLRSCEISVFVYNIQLYIIHVPIDVYILLVRETIFSRLRFCSLIYIIRCKYILLNKYNLSKVTPLNIQ